MWVLLGLDYKPYTCLNHMPTGLLPHVCCPGAVPRAVTSQSKLDAPQQGAGLERDLRRAELS